MLEPDASITDTLRLVESQKRALKRLKLETLRDLLYHFPARYQAPSAVTRIENLKAGANATIVGSLKNLKTEKTFKARVPSTRADIEDDTGRIRVIWFNQPYLGKMFQEGMSVHLTGKVTERRGKPTMANPEIEPVTAHTPPPGESLFGNNGDVVSYPVYPESRGVTSRWFYHAIQKLLRQGILDTLEDPIPEEILKRYNLPTLTTALVWIHAPKKERDGDAARKRFAFEEVFFIQLAKQQDRREYASKNAYLIQKKPKDVRGFVERFPFTPTTAQTRTINTILKDFDRGHPMSRFLEGDVGSGKTAVAATTAYAAATSRPDAGKDFGNLQVAYMAPTEILAKQHFESFIKYFEHLPINVGLITGSGCRKFPSKVNPAGWTDISRTQLLKWVANGEIPILIGTHALIQKSVVFQNLAYVVIDEQHRFGTAQRQKLARKEGFAPHLLSMSATPIPRTLALTIYGDLDLSLLDEMPKGRKPIVTEVIVPAQRRDAYAKIQNELDAGRQVYVICPRIDLPEPQDPTTPARVHRADGRHADEPDPTKLLALNAKSVKAEAKRLKKDVFKNNTIDILHSKMKPKDRDETMRRFLAHEIDILVATSVVEVGVDVPNATVIMIEGAERFGLAQLHQLRGRVIRSNHQAYCYALTASKTKVALARLKALKTAKNGFELAELDLKLRGSGELYGLRQWGLSDIGMEALKNIKMVEAAREEASKLLDADPDLSENKAIADTVAQKREQLHFE